MNTTKRRIATAYIYIYKQKFLDVIGGEIFSYLPLQPTKKIPEISNSQRKEFDLWL